MLSVSSHITHPLWFFKHLFSKNFRGGTSKLSLEVSASRLRRSMNRVHVPPREDCFACLITLALVVLRRGSLPDMYMHSSMCMHSSMSVHSSMYTHSSYMHSSTSMHSSMYMHSSMCMHSSTTGGMYMHSGTSIFSYLHPTSPWALDCSTAMICTHM